MPEDMVPRVCPRCVCGPGTLCYAGIPATLEVKNANARTCRAWIPAEYCCGTRDCPDEDTGPCSLKTCPNVIMQIVKEGYCHLA